MIIFSSRNNQNRRSSLSNVPFKRKPFFWTAMRIRHRVR